MKVSAWLLAVALAAPADSLPEPPVPPDQIPQDEAAPVPDQDARAPSAADRSGLQVRPEMFRKPSYVTGQGYANGSQFHDSEDRKVIQTPGVRLWVPIQ